MKQSASTIGALAICIVAIITWALWLAYQTVNQPQLASFAIIAVVIVVLTAAAVFALNRPKNRDKGDDRPSLNEVGLSLDQLPLASYRCLADRDRTIVHVSSGIEAITGHPCGAFGSGGISWDDIVMFDDPKASAAAAADQGPYHGTVEYRIIHRNGAVRWVLDQHQGVTDDSGALVYWDGILLDVTEKKGVEQDLIRAKERADDANAAKASFLATMSHEIRTPMNGIIGMTALLLNTDLRREQRQLANSIDHSGKALLDIVNDILDFSKIEAGKMEIEEAPFKLLDCIEGACELVAAKASEKSIDIGALVEPDVPAYIIADQGRLRQVLLNLLSNAVKFTDRGGIAVEVRLESESAADVPDGQLRITVIDTGPGISEQNIPALYDRFSQVDVSSTRTVGGTGLGLAIAKELTELMGGRVGVDSKLGAGSRFWLTLPIKIATEEPVDVREDFLTGHGVMIFDKNTENRRILIKNLESLGALCVAVDSAEQALQAFDDSTGDKLDMVIIDRLMSPQDGEAISRKIQELADSREIYKVLAASDLITSNDDARALGFDAALPKPITESSITRALAPLFGLEIDPIVAQQEAAQESPPASPGEVDLKVLLAEDNRVNQLLVVAILGQVGIEVVVAQNGREAVEQLDQCRFDLILMDMQMPEMDGLEATRVIRRRTDSKGVTPIIALTANVIKGDKERCIQAGMNDYVPKPVNQDLLLEKIAHWTGVGPLASPNAPQAPDTLSDLLSDLDSLQKGR